MRYLGVDVEDALNLAEHTEIHRNMKIGPAAACHQRSASTPYRRTDVLKHVLISGHATSECWLQEFEDDARRKQERSEGLSSQ